MSKLTTDLRQMIATTSQFGGLEKKQAVRLANLLVPFITQRIFSHKSDRKSTDKGRIE